MTHTTGNLSVEVSCNVDETDIMHCAYKTIFIITLCLQKLKAVLARHIEGGGGRLGLCVGQAHLFMLNQTVANSSIAPGQVSWAESWWTPFNTIWITISSCHHITIKWEFWLECSQCEIEVAASPLFNANNISMMLYLKWNWAQYLLQ